MNANIIELIADVEVKERVEAKMKAAYEVAHIAAQAARNALAARLGIVQPRRGPGRPPKSEAAVAVRTGAASQPFSTRSRREDELPYVPTAAQQPESEPAQLDSVQPQKRKYRPRSANLTSDDRRAAIEAACNDAGETDGHAISKAFEDLGYARGSDTRAIKEGITNNWLVRISPATLPKGRHGTPSYVAPQCARYHLASRMVQRPLDPSVVSSSADSVVAPAPVSPKKDDRPSLIFVGQKEEQCRRLAENVGGRVEKWYDGSHPNIVTSDKTDAIIAITKFYSHNASAAALAVGRKTGIPAILLPGTSDKLLRMRLVAAGVLENTVVDEHVESGKVL